MDIITIIGLIAAILTILTAIISIFNKPVRDWIKKLFTFYRYITINSEFEILESDRKIEKFFHRIETNRTNTNRIKVRFKLSKKEKKLRRTTKKEHEDRVDFLRHIDNYRSKALMFENGLKILFSKKGIEMHSSINGYRESIPTILRDFAKTYKSFAYMSEQRAATFDIFTTLHNKKQIVVVIDLNASELDSIMKKMNVKNIEMFMPGFAYLNDFGEKIYMKRALPRILNEISKNKDFDIENDIANTFSLYTWNLGLH